MTDLTKEVISELDQTSDIDSPRFGRELKKQKEILKALEEEDEVIESPSTNIRALRKHSQKYLSAKRDQEQHLMQNKSTK